MEIVYTSCAGLDVHKATVVACVRRQRGPGKAQQQTRTFGTTTGALLEMADWLSEQGVTHLAMESTGVYWKPIWNLLEGLFEMLLVNAQHIKQVPGRKTDVKDAEWIAQLLQHGLLHGSFVPQTPQRQLRELTRQRRQLIQTRASDCAQANRIGAVQAALIGGEALDHRLELARRRIEFLRREHRPTHAHAERQRDEPGWSDHSLPSADC